MRKEITAEHSIAFDISNYDNDESKLFADIGKILQILVLNDYQCAVRYDDCGIYIIEYNYDNPEIGTPMIYWLNEEQKECLYTSDWIGMEEEK